VLDPSAIPVQDEFSDDEDEVLTVEQKKDLMIALKRIEGIHSNSLDAIVTQIESLLVRCPICMEAKDILIKLNKRSNIRRGDRGVIVAGTNRCEYSRKLTHGHSVAGCTAGCSAGA
jgi:hypothetical protein